MTGRELLEARIKVYEEERTRLTEELYKIISRVDSLEILICEFTSILNRESDPIKSLAVLAKTYGPGEVMGETKAAGQPPTRKRRMGRPPKKIEGPT
jgi:hypothetical protein